jgi:hypothetical protein
MRIPWQDIAYLGDGNERQRAAYGALESLGVMHILGAFSPVLVGTIPIGIDVQTSDLDIVCEAQDLVAFERRVIEAFGQGEGFRVRRKWIKGVPSVVANLRHGGFEVEIFGQPQPVAEQHAYRHMVVEARLLAIGGEEARREIRRLKASGLKTEPAFARYFGLAGDPFEVLLELSRLGEEELRDRVWGAHQREE